MEHRAGIRAHDIGHYSETELPRRLAEQAVPYVQLTLDDAFGSRAPGAKELNSGYAGRIRRAFDTQNVGIAVLSCYINPIHPDPSVRRAQLDKFCAYVRHARDFGCSLVATETGSCMPDLSFSPANYGAKAMALLLESLYEMTDRAERYGVTVLMEGVHKFVAHSPDDIETILHVVPSENLQVILDPVNLLCRAEEKTAMDLVEESFARYGDRIAALHAKDYIRTESGAIRQVPVGQGSLNWERIAALCAEYKPWLPVILEDSEPDRLQQELSVLDTFFAACGES